jgi:hypothetical protein
MRPKQTGVSVESMSTYGSYQLLMGDLYFCPDCDRQVVAGFGREPIASNHEANYQQTVLEASATSLLIRFWRNAEERRLYEEGRVSEETR